MKFRTQPEFWLRIGPSLQYHSPLCGIAGWGRAVHLLHAILYYDASSFSSLAMIGTRSSGPVKPTAPTTMFSHVVV